MTSLCDGVVQPLEGDLQNAYNGTILHGQVCLHSIAVPAYFSFGKSGEWRTQDVVSELILSPSQMISKPLHYPIKCGAQVEGFFVPLCCVVPVKAPRDNVIDPSI